MPSGCPVVRLTLAGAAARLRFLRRLAGGQLLGQARGPMRLRRLLALGVIIVNAVFGGRGVAGPEGLPLLAGDRLGLG